MPIYEFMCGDCNKIFETFYASSENIINCQCPYCNNNNIKKIISKANSRVLQDHENLRKNTGCKGFTVLGNDGKQYPLYNKYKID